MAATILLLGLLLVGTGQQLASHWSQGLERSQSTHMEELLGIFGGRHRQPQGSAPLSCAGWQLPSWA